MTYEPPMTKVLCIIPDMIIKHGGKMKKNKKESIYTTIRISRKNKRALNKINAKNADLAVKELLRGKNDKKNKNRK